MARRGNKRDPKKSPVGNPPDKFNQIDQTSSREAASSKGTPRTLSRRKVWAFRIATAVGIPLLLFVVLELVLRIGGFGYPTGFYLRSERDGKPVFVENERFAWRFFGPKLARSPNSMSLPVEKPQDTIRVCVFGESAAFGDPQPDYGLPRMLEAMLSLRHPGIRFEVINAAMTGINSHTVREIAKDSVAIHSDIWIVYMGNNEVVGPFGAGTVFGTKTPPLPLIRANLAFKRARVGQLLERMLPAGKGTPGGADEWGGMEMFEKNKVARDDPRMETVYHHFQSNLEDIVELARRNNIGVIVSTVAVNLRDCAPFASATRTDLTTDQTAKWDELYKKSIELQQAGNDADAAAGFEQAAQIDDKAADLQFRWGQALLKAGDVAEARRHLQLACDLDQLRFRCDSRLNNIIHDVAAGHEAERIRYVDAAEAFHERSSPQISGKENFYEHVHLTFEGNYLLARLLAEQVERLLPKDKLAENSADADWPTRDQCADRLAWSRLSLRNALEDMLARLDDPPFTNQLNHAEQVRDVAGRLAQLRDVAQPASLKMAAEQCRRAVAEAPDDHVLQSQLALLSGQTGDAEGAYQAALKAAQLLPHNAGKHFQLGIVLATQHRDEEAIAAFKKGLQLKRDDIWMRHELAKAFIRLNRKEEALDQVQRAVAINPRYGPAYLTIGMLLEERGQMEKANENYRQALEHRVHRAADMAVVAQLCQRKRWFEEAVTNYLDTLRMSPFDPTLHLGAAQCLDEVGRHDEAEKHFTQLLALAPESAQARYQFGVHFAKLGDDVRAAEQFGAAASMKPDFTVARIDYAMALIACKREREALAQFNEVLAREPANATALEFKAEIEKELGIGK